MLEWTALDIDPVNAAADAYKVGGIALVSLIVSAIAIWLVLRFVFKRMDSRDLRVAQVEDSKSKLLEGVIRENAAAVRDGTTAIVRAGDRQTDAINQLIAVLGERPCFDARPTPEVAPVIPIARRHRTPLPQKYQQP